MPMQSHDSPSPAPIAIGEEAPNFTARSTQGMISLSDYRGQWLVLFSHPADFTPVCTSEFMAIAHAAPRFEALGCARLALSVDSLFSHFAWLRMIRDSHGVTVDFPILEDPTLEIARAYGMVPPDAADASAVRATYFLDPQGILRASTFYPATIGRSVDEMLRIVAALQRVAGGDLLAPEGWQPGGDLLAMPPQDAADVLGAEGATDWFYRRVADRGDA